MQIATRAGNVDFRSLYAIVVCCTKYSTAIILELITACMRKIYIFSFYFALPVSYVQRCSIFAPADDRRWESFCRTANGQWLRGVGQERRVTNVHVNAFLDRHCPFLLLSDDSWSVYSRSAQGWNQFRPVVETVCGWKWHQTPSETGISQRQRSNNGEKRSSSHTQTYIFSHIW